MNKFFVFSKNYLLVPFVILLLLTSCKRKHQQPEIDPAFAGYIAAFTSGIISNQSAIIIQLQDIHPDAVEGEIIDKNLFSFSPGIKGETHWKDNRTIEFTPEEPLPSGRLFETKFYLSKIIDVPKKLKTLEFQFQTIKQSINVEYSGMKAYNHFDLSWQKLYGTLSTTDNANDDNIEKLFTAIQKGKHLKVNWKHVGDNRTHEFTVDSVRRTEERGEVILEWDGEIIDADKGGNLRFEIPSLREFKVINVSLDQQPEQVITLFFSDPLKEENDVSGLIYLKSGIEVRLMINENEVKVYPVTRQTSTTSVIVETGVKNVMNYNLMERFERNVTFTNIKPVVELIGNGVILPSTNGLILPFKTVNLKSVNVKIIKIFENNIAQFLQINQLDGTNELKRVGRIVYNKSIVLKGKNNLDYGIWNTFALDLSALIKVEPGAIYRVIIGFDKSQSVYPCENEGEESSENLFEDEEVEDNTFDSPENYYYDDYEYYYDEAYNYDEREDPCKDAYYKLVNRSVSRNVFSSDLGIIAKGGNSNNLFVAVTDIRTTDELSDVDIEIYNFQNQLLSKTKTNSDGIANINLEKKPFLLIARKDGQFGYLRLDDGSALSLSMFDIGGEETNKGVKGMIYGERGVWRPGDSLYISFILEDKNKILPENHPVIFELYTPENQLFERKIKISSINGFYDFRTVTGTDVPTGNWLAKVKVGGSKFTKTIKIETIKPNRLKINLDFHSKILDGSASNPCELEVRWLHGAVAKNLSADVSVTLKAGNTTFDKYPGYVFDNPSLEFESEEKTMFDGTLDAEGKARLDARFDVKDNAPGLLKAQFKVRVFEKGGDFSIDQFSLPYSPYESYVGLKVPKGPGWNGSLYSNEPNLIPVVTVDQKGKAVNRNRVEIKVYELDWRWWWENNEEDDLAQYIANSSNSLIKTDYINTSNGKAIYEMKLNMDSWGRKLIIVTDPVSGHSAGQLFYTSYKGWWNNQGQDSPVGAEMLTFSTDKEKYNVGEEVKIQLPVNEKGKALVSIESGSNVVSTFWVESGKDNSSFSFKATEEMSPNVYIHISYIQPHNQTNNDRPIRLYGVQYIGVEDPKTHLEPKISMPDILAPEENVTIKITEAKGRKMTYTLAIVDEGLLDLTRFSAPDAWKHFYSREALGVKTWDMYKYVMGAFAGELSGLLAIGGDEEISKKGGQKANRFKPVVKFIGPVVLGASETKTHTFMMPNYIGSVKTMVVAGNEGAFGSIEKVTPVKKPLMVLATLPRVIGPSESVRLPVTVFAMDKTVKNVTVEVETNELFKLVGEGNKNVNFTSESDKVVYFDLEVAEKIGIGKVKVVAKSGNLKATYDVEMDVRISNPRITMVIDGIVESGKSWSADYKPIGIAGTNNGTLEVSSVLPINLDKRLKFLMTYPHGCIEQTTSAVFPQLYLGSLIELTSEQKKKIDENIRAGIDRLRSFQLANGGLTYWPGESGYADDWGTNYAGHFMIEAQAKGYSLPGGFLKGWIEFQKDRANEWSANLSGDQSYYYSSNELIQAYRLYTLALAGKPALGAMNRMHEMSKISLAAKWRLAAAYYLAGRPDIAKELVSKIGTHIEPYKELSYTYGSTERDEAMILETLCLINDLTNAKSILTQIASNLASENWYSTQTTAYSLLAIAKFTSTSEGSNKLNYKVQFNNGKSEKISSESPFSQQKIKVSGATNGNVKVTNSGSKRLFVKLQLDGIPLSGVETDAENALNLNINYLDMDGNKMDPSTIKQGTDFIAEVKVHNPGIRGNYEEMALTQIFPSGWEIQNIRMIEGASIGMIDIPRYQDIRDDRVLSYFNLRTNEAKTFRVLLNAAYPGRYYLPAVYCEAMYDNEINARKAGKWVEVTGEE
jgi:alpha-2-macroglobulin